MAAPARSRLVWDGETISPHEWVYRLVAALMDAYWRAALNGNPLGSVELHWAPQEDDVSLKMSGTVKGVVSKPKECPPLAPPSLRTGQHHRQRRLG